MRPGWERRLDLDEIEELAEWLEQREKRDEIDPIVGAERAYMDRLWSVVIAWDQGGDPTVFDFVLAERG